MAYIDAFVAPVPNANKDVFIEHSRKMAEIFKEYGALNSVDCWGDDVPDGEITSFPLAVKCKPDETVCFGWITWPSREARNAGIEKMMADERMNPETSPMPFDGMRLIYGGFAVVRES